MSPLTVEPQNGMPFMGDMQPYGIHGLPYVTGPQNGFPSSMDSMAAGQHYSMDSTASGQHYSMDSTAGGQQHFSIGSSGFVPLPPYMPPSRQDAALSIEGVHQRFGNRMGPFTDTANVETEPCKLF